MKRRDAWGKIRQRFLLPTLFLQLFFAALPRAPCRRGSPTSMSAWERHNSSCSRPRPSSSRRVGNSGRVTGFCRFPASHNIKHQPAPPLCHDADRAKFLATLPRLALTWNTLSPFVRFFPADNNFYFQLTYAMLRLSGTVNSDLKQTSGVAIPGTPSDVPMRSRAR